MRRGDTYLVVWSPLGSFIHILGEKKTKFLSLMVSPLYIPQNCIIDYQQDMHIVLIPDVIPPFIQNITTEQKKNCTEQYTERPQIVLTILERY